MNITPLKWKAGYKYQVQDTFCLFTEIVGHAFQLPFANMTQDGVLTVERGYAWDGASGPTKDTPNTMRGSCVHDVFYQAIRARKLPESFRSVADNWADKIWEHDGMWWPRRKIWLAALRRFAAFAAKPENERKVEVFP